MTERKPQTPSPEDSVLDLLLDALLARQQARGESGSPSPEPPPAQAAAKPQPELPAAEIRTVETGPETAKPEESEEPLPPPAPMPAGQMGRTLLRLAVGLLVFIVLVNVPINRHGVSLARVMPDSAALIIRDGLLLKAENSPEIYVLQDEKLRWISSMEAFERLHYRWSNVHIVEASFLARFEKGQPVHVLLKCDGSPHIYRIEREQKRWIRDIPTFEAEGHIWEDVQFVSCQYLRGIPDGPPIPEDAGPPPQP